MPAQERKSCLRGLDTSSVSRFIGNETSNGQTASYCLERVTLEALFGTSGRIIQLEHCKTTELCHYLNLKNIQVAS